MTAGVNRILKENSMKMIKRMSRREFFQATMLGGLASLVSFKSKGLAEKLTSDVKEIKLEFRSLGKTGMKVTSVGFGAMITSDPSVIHHAIDLGINYIDTAASYMGGNNEIMVGNVLKTRRKETFIATKTKFGAENEIIQSVQKSLKKLQTDVIDVIQLHGLDDKRDILNNEAMNALSNLRKKGMVRFVGFSTHENQVECLEAAIESKFYDMVLVAYHFKSDPAIGDAIKKAGEAGIGIVAMKTQAGGYQGKDMGGWSPHQAALRWVLNNPQVATTIPSMVSVAQVDENVQAMKSSLGLEDKQILDQYGLLYDKEICRMCGSCRKQCPQNIPIQDVNRCLMYAEGYRNYDLAVKTYQDLVLSACKDCRSCVVRCQNDLDIPARLHRAKELFGSVRV
jgi:uncharacterized protein